MSEQVKRGPGRPRKNPEKPAKAAESEQVETVATPEVMAIAQKAIADGVAEEDVYATIVYDPFAYKNPHEFKKHPKGKRLSWLNPRLRDRTGMLGYKYVTYDDPIGRNLDEFVQDPPCKMEGTAEHDRFVRRGDTILGWLPWGIWRARQIAREDKARRNVQAVAGRQNTQAGEGESFGRGLQVDKNPTAVALEDDADMGRRGVTQPGVEIPRDEREL